MKWSNFEWTTVKKNHILTILNKLQVYRYTKLSLWNLCRYIQDQVCDENCFSQRDKIYIVNSCLGNQILIKHSTGTCIWVTRLFELDQH